MVLYIPRDLSFVIYFKPISCPKLWYIYYKFDILLLFYYINLRSVIVRCFFLEIYIFLLVLLYLIFYILFHFNCFWVILWWTFWCFHDFMSNCIKNQITSCLCCFLNSSFWNRFKYIWSRLFNMINKFLTAFTT